MPLNADRLEGRVDVHDMRLGNANEITQLPVSANAKVEWQSRHRPRPRISLYRISKKAKFKL